MHRAMKSLAVVSIFASVALASTSPLIPQGISSNCSNYLSDFDADTSLSSCTSTILNATQYFGAAAPAGSSPSASDVDTALSTLCSTASACPATTIQSELTQFYTACNAELSSNSNDQVLLLYDALYTMLPTQSAICTKDDSGNFCAKGIAANGTTSSSTLTTISQYLWSTVQSSMSVARAVGRRDTTTSNSTSPMVTPNATTIASHNLLYLLLNPSMSTSSLCQTCTRNILMAFVQFESNTPYAPGLAQSPLMSGQSALYQAVDSQCGESFLSGAVEAAGSLSGGILGGSSGALSTVGNIGAVGVAMGTLLLGAMMML